MSNRLLSSFLMLLLLLGISISGIAQPLQAKEDSSQVSDNSFWDHFQWVKSDQADIHEINFVGGYSFHSSRGFWGKIPKAKLSIFIFRYNRKLLNVKKRHLIEYVGEITLVANYTLQNTARFQAGSYTGYGITPVGFQFNWRKDKTVQPFVKSSTGFMYFDKKFPDDRGTKFNFTLELGTGLEIVFVENLSFTIGYKYHHLSNFFRGKINPGVDSNIFYTGITIF